MTVPLRNVSRQISQCHRKLRDAYLAAPGPQWGVRVGRQIVALGKLDLKLRAVAYPKPKKAKQR